MINLSLQHQIGAIAGWRLEMREVTLGAINPGPSVHTFSSDDYRGSVEATLVSGLAPGRYTVVVEDVSERDFGKLTESARGKNPLEARLFLYWLDAPRPIPGITGLVSVLRVTGLRRRPGNWRYQMIVEAREWVYDLLTLRCPGGVTGQGALDAAVKLARAMFVEVDIDPALAGAAPAADAESFESDPNLRGFEQMAELERAMIAKAAKDKKPRAGLGGMYLMREDKLRIGPDRIKEPASRPMINRDTGLLDIQRTRALRDDETSPGGEVPAVVSGGKVTHRDRFAITLRGRPDLRPGDIVDFESPEQEGFGKRLGFALGPGPQALAGTLVTAYIDEVSHRLSREQGFITVVQCVAAATGVGEVVPRLWFHRLADDAEGGSSETAVSGQMSRTRDATRPDRWPDVAQVRAQHRPGSGVNTPPLTEKLWRGLEEADGVKFAAGKQPFAKAKKVLTAAPYATPFAFGAWGLVVPRYLGMRVLVVNRGGNPEDAIDVGALWSRGSGPSAEMGDWWLCLPVDLDGQQAPRASLADNETVEPPSDGKSTNDLIDAQGNRVIEVGKLTIRVGKDILQSPIARPVAFDEPVCIDHNNGAATITIAQDGSIRITSTKTLTLTGKDGITLESDGNVTINVKGQVNVTKKTGP